MNMNTWVW